MTSDQEYIDDIREMHESRGVEQPYKILVDDRIRYPFYVFERCEQCGKRYAFVVDSSRYHKWKDREMLVQKAFPGISPEDREILMTQICGECFIRIFGSLNRKRSGGRFSRFFAKHRRSDGKRRY